MKKIISDLAIIASIALLGPGYLSAQNSSGSSYASNSRPNSYPTGEGTLSNPGADEKPGKATIKALKENLKVTQANFRSSDDFNRNYQHATDVKWVTEKDAIVVSFKIGELVSHSAYDKKGNRLHTILNYYEDGLPDDVRRLVKRNYPNLKITLVQEILQGDAKVHVIHLEDENNLKQILVCNGEITPYKDFKKTP